MLELTDSAVNDQAFLDALLDRAIRALEDGYPLDADEVSRERPDLRLQIERVLRLAQEISPGPVQAMPVVPGYSVLAELGHGGMGAVYLARQSSLGDRPVALKILPPSAAFSQRARQRFLHEAHAIAKLRHPNVVAIYDVVHEKGICAYAMEWVDGRSFGELIDRLSMADEPPTMASVRKILECPPGAALEGTPTVFVCRVGISVARALAAVHSAGLLHRDIKPSNILLRRDGAALLSDFGLVREADSKMQTVEGQFAGTPAYAPPEQLRGDTESLDARSDIYALGVTLYHGLALRLPHSGSTTVQLLKHIEAGQILPLRKVNPKLPTDLQTIVEKAMEPDPSRRYQTAEEMADDIERLINLQPIKAKPAGLVTRVVKLARRKRGVVITAIISAALSLVLATMASVYWFLVPRWVKQHVDEARLALLDPRQNNLIWNVIFIGTHDPDGFEIPFNTLGQALESYEKAGRWHSLDSETLLERETIKMILNVKDQVVKVQSDDSVAAPITIAAQAPLTSAFVEEWMRTRHVPKIPSDKLQNASPADLRCLGLTAFLCGNVQTTLAAWSRLDLVAEPDSFVEGALGQLYLVLEQPARAYPRLRTAVAAFPDVGFLAICLADAAVQCGDLEKAEHFLEKARTLPRGDPMGGWSRVKADMDAAAGRDRLAREEYHRLFGYNPIAVYHYARYLESRGETLLALRTYQGCEPGTMRHFASLMERYWKSLSPRQRWRMLRRVLDERVPTPLGESYARDGGSNWVMFQTYPYAIRQEAARNERPPRDAARRHLLTVCENVGSWGQDRHHPLQHAYPHFLKDMQAAAWLSPMPRVATRLVTGMYRLYSVCRGVGTRPAAFPSSLRAEFIPMGDLPGGDFASAVTDISADGSMVVGSSRSALGLEALCWRNGRLDGLGIPKGEFAGSIAQAVSADGATVVGYGLARAGPPRPIRWDNGAVTELPLPIQGVGASARDVSGDGRVIVGAGLALGSVFWRRAENGGEPRVTHVTELEFMCVSSDGSTAAGSATDEFKYPAIWREDKGMTKLTHPVGERLYSRILAASADGSVLVGTSLRPATARHGQLHEAYRWVMHQAGATNEQATVEPLGDLPGGSDDSLACGVSGDGRVIVGWGFGSGGYREACIWDDAGIWTSATSSTDEAAGEGDRGTGSKAPAAAGLLQHKRTQGKIAGPDDTADSIPPRPISLRERLVNEYGLDLSGWVLTEARAVSTDGRTIAGNGLNADGNEEGWIVRLLKPPNE